MMALASALAAAGCAAPKAVTFEAPPGRYAEAFEAARNELRAAGFELDRVDAQSGVITTRARASAGVFTPWIGDESTPEAEFESTLNLQRRHVRIDFEPATIAAAGGQPPPADTASPVDLRAYSGPIQARVSVSIERRSRTGLQVSDVSVRLMNQTTDPSPAGPRPAAWRVVREDEALAGRLAGQIAHALAGAPSGTGD